MANYSDTEGEIFEVDYLLDHRGRGKSVEYLVRWRGFGEEEDSWEPLKNLGAAEEAVMAYRAKNLVKTPRRQSRGRDGAGDASAVVERSASKTKTGTVTKTIVKTQTITKTEAKNTLGTMSESSSPEASPTVTRKSLRSRKTEEIEVKKADADSNSTKKKNDGPSRLSSLGSMLMAPCRMCHCVRLGTKDIPIMVLVTCLMVIASSFYIAGK